MPKRIRQRVTSTEEEEVCDMEEQERGQEEDEEMADGYEKQKPKQDDEAEDEDNEAADEEDEGDVNGDYDDGSYRSQRRREKSKQLRATTRKECAKQNKKTYGKFFNTLCDALEKQQPSTFVCSGDVKPIAPGLVVQGVGEIGLPICKEQAELVIARCTQAPFGRGEQTIIDTSVRNTWQLEPSAFTLENPSWLTSLNAILTDIGESLNFPKSVKIDAKLYKLLLYQTGGHFQKHKDTEKEPGMFGSLIIELLSNYTGGHLIVENGEARVEYDFTTDSRFHMHYVAFYADCLHQLMPVTSGHRLCLVYNLIQTQQAASAPQHSLTCAQSQAPIQNPFAFCSSPQTAAQTAAQFAPFQPALPFAPISTPTLVPPTISAPTITASAPSQPKTYLSSQVSDMVEKWKQDSKRNLHYIMFILQHEYSQQGIDWNNLKGPDRALSACLRAAQHLNPNFSLYLAQMSASDQVFGDDDDGGEREQYENVDIYTSHSRISHVIDQSRKVIAWNGSINQNNKHITWFTPSQRMVFEWDHVNAHATGNDGVEYERSYQRWVLMLVPRDNLCEMIWKIAGRQDTYESWFQRTYTTWEQATSDKDKQIIRQTCLQIAHMILDQHSPKQPQQPQYYEEEYYGGGRHPSIAETPEIICSILSLDDIGIAKRLIGEYMTQIHTYPPSYHNYSYQAQMIDFTPIISFCDRMNSWDDMPFEKLFPPINVNNYAQSCQQQIQRLQQLAGFNTNSSGDANGTASVPSAPSASSIIPTALPTQFYSAPTSQSSAYLYLQQQQTYGPNVDPTAQLLGIQQQRTATTSYASSYGVIPGMPGQYNYSSYISTLPTTAPTPTPVDIPPPPVVDPEVTAMTTVRAALPMTDLPLDICDMIASYYETSRRTLVHHFLSQLVTYVLKYTFNIQQAQHAPFWNEIRTLAQQIDAPTIIQQLDTVLPPPPAPVVPAPAPISIFPAPTASNLSAAHLSGFTTTTPSFPSNVDAAAAAAAAVATSAYHYQHQFISGGGNTDPTASLLGTTRPSTSSHTLTWAPNHTYPTYPGLAHATTSLFAQSSNNIPSQSQSPTTTQPQEEQDQLAKPGEKKSSEEKPNKSQTTAIKSAMSGFMFYCQAERKNVIEERPEMGFGEIGAELGRRWRALTVEQQAPYEHMAKADLARFNEEVGKYSPCS